jgi:hypothetical protein
MWWRAVVGGALIIGSYAIYRARHGVTAQGDPDNGSGLSIHIGKDDSDGGGD